MMDMMPMGRRDVHDEIFILFCIEMWRARRCFDLTQRAQRTRSFSFESNAEKQR